MTPGRLTAVGVGPGDPGLVTVAGAAAVRAADVVAYYAGTGRSSVARATAAPYLPAGVVEEELAFPVTTGRTDHPGGYYGAVEEFYDEVTERLAAHLAAGREVVLLAEGDAFFYGSFMAVHDRLAGRAEVRVVPGVTSPAAATAAAGLPLARHEDVLTVLPGTLPVPELARRLAGTDAAVVLKLGRTFPAVREALRQAGLLERAVYVERVSSDRQRVLPVAEVDPAQVPYLSLVLVPGPGRRADAAGRATGRAPGTANGTGTGAGRLRVVGLGPAGGQWLTPEAAAVLAEVGHVVGYGPYVDRVPQRPGLTRHASGNTVEVDRARLALDLALAGEDVAVVSGGDAGVFGMASAVFEAAEADAGRYRDVPVEVVPGLTAAQAVAARAGAPLGGDWAMISLSDRLKPWHLVERRLRLVAEADLALALYNPRSRSRPHQLHRAREVLLEVRDPGTAVVVGRAVGRDGERLEVTTLGGFDPATVDMSCLVIVGASGTRVTAGGRVWTPRSVPGDPAAAASTSASPASDAR